MQITSKLRQQEIPYQSDSARLVNSIAGIPWTIYLDSSRQANGSGRYDIIVSEPVKTLTTLNGITSVCDGNHRKELTGDPFELLRQELPPPCGHETGYPFTGGAVGYFSYDLGRVIEKLPTRAGDDMQLPEMAVGIYDCAVVIDHVERRSALVSSAIDNSNEARWNGFVERFSQPLADADDTGVGIAGQIQSNMTPETYRQAFERIQSYIHAGDCYQVNLAQRFSLNCRVDPWALYRQLRAINPAPFSAYLNLPFAQIMSSSPERFLQLRDGQVESRPIKGTRPRMPDPHADARIRRELSQSAKDRAENLMIVDLLRNDLGRSCRPGSIVVSRLFDVESFAGVHHLVSTIRGQLASDRDALQLLRSAFPGGSITGAPKVRAMEIIEELEPHRRGIYCGSIGYIGCDGDMDTNIAIRTLLYKDGVLSYGAGGGIVADSDWHDEYRETYHKARAFFQLLGADDAST